MDCREAEGLFSPAALGDLGAEALERLDAHCAECPACRDAYAQTRAALSLLEAAPEPAPQLAARVANAGRAKLAAQGLRAWRWHLVSSVSFLAACTALAVGLYFGRAQPDTPVAARPHAESERAGDAHWCFVDGDAGNSRWSDAREVPVPNRVVWEQRVEGVPGIHKPLLWKDLIVVGTQAPDLSGTTKGPRHRGGGLLALDARTGAVRWRKEFLRGDFYKERHYPDRGILGGKLYITDGDCCRVLDAHTGAESETIRPPEGANGWSYLAADGGALFGLARDGRTAFSVDLSTGACRWTRPLAESAHLPALGSGTLFVQVRSGEVLALDAATGAERWRAEGAPRARASVHANGGHLLVVAETGELEGRDAATGERRWTRRLFGAFASGLAMDGERVYLHAGSLALALNDGSVAWKMIDAQAGLCSAPTLAKDTVLTAAGASAGEIRMVSNTGERIAALDLDAKWACEGAVVGDGRIFVVGDGRLKAFGR
ncbi:MAG: PQQ-binding-like beta-propeller repeat protein [Planctomycetes bacterium]|nr:PQQ-binding-like beta-propeller repeat protein [Planctomycetota bacterium]